MRFYKYYEQPDFKEVERLIRNSSHCQLITGGDRPRVGVFNPVYLNEKIYLHLNRGDEQLKQLKNSSDSLLVFLDFLGTIPSHWVDAEYAGAATSYYRYVELECTSKIIEDHGEMTPILQAMMDHFQPEKKYQPLDPDNSLYMNSYKTICVVEFKTKEFRTKWKLGQNRPSEVRKKVAHLFKERGGEAGLRAYEEILRSVEQQDAGEQGSEV